MIVLKFKPQSQIREITEKLVFYSHSILPACKTSQNINTLSDLEKRQPQTEPVK